MTVPSGAYLPIDEADNPSGAPSGTKVWVIPAIHYHSLVAGSGIGAGHQWEYVDDEGSAEGGNLKGLPDNDVIMTTATGPRALYTFKVPASSAVSVNVRGLRGVGDTGSIRTDIFINDDEAGAENPYFLSSWSYAIESEDIYVSPVLSEGENTLVLSMSRDNQSVDRFIISTDTTYDASLDTTEANALPLSAVEAAGGIVGSITGSIIGSVIGSVIK